MTDHTAYMSREALSDLVDIVYERQSTLSGSYYEIFWYHWPNDGLLFWDDYEPIVFAYNRRHDLCFVLVRRAWKFIMINPDEVYWPPEILFKGKNHHQFIRMRTDDFGDFEPSNLRSHIALNATTSDKIWPVDSAHKIPNWNISGLGGNIHEKIKAAMYESCED
jgi:hypothetical protein